MHDAIRGVRKGVRGDPRGAAPKSVVDMVRKRVDVQGRARLLREHIQGAKRAPKAARKAKASLNKLAKKLRDPAYR